jgi:hypothetical protein
VVAEEDNHLAQGQAQELCQLLFLLASRTMVRLKKRKKNCFRFLQNIILIEHGFTLFEK